MKYLKVSLMGILHMQLCRDVANVDYNVQLLNYVVALAFVRLQLLGQKMLIYALVLIIL